MTDVVLQAPEKHERRHKQQDSSTRPQHAPQLGQTCEIVVQVFDDVERGYEIERAVFVWERFSSAEPDFIEPALATERECVF